MQSCHEYFVHTPLPRAANETLARVLVDRWQTQCHARAIASAVDLGIYIVAHDADARTPEVWRLLLDVQTFAADWRSHLHASDLLANAFGAIAQTGLMVLRNPLGRKRKVGGKDWAERRLFEQIRERAPDFILLQQAEAEASHAMCDFAGASSFLDRVTSLPIRLRHLAQASPFGESMLQGRGIATSVNYRTDEEPI